jgi:hypothetical protein
MTAIRGTRVIVYYALGSQEPQPVFSFENAFAGVKGKCFLYDQNTSGTAVTRWYDPVSLWTPAYDAVLYASLSARLSTNGMFRQSQDGVGYGPIGFPGTDLPRLPVSGPKETPVEIALKPSRGDFDQLSDSGLDKLTAQISYRPSFSHIPAE